LVAGPLSSFPSCLFLVRSCPAALEESPRLLGQHGSLFLALWASFLVFLIRAPEIIIESEIERTASGLGLRRHDLQFYGIYWSLDCLVPHRGERSGPISAFPAISCLKEIAGCRQAGGGRPVGLAEGTVQAPTAEPIEDSSILDLPPEIPDLTDLSTAEPLSSEEDLEIPGSQQSLPLETAANFAGCAHSPERRISSPAADAIERSPPDSPDAPDELRSKAKRLQAALADFGVGAKVVKVNPGPVITRFDLEPDPESRSAASVPWRMIWRWFSERVLFAFRLRSPAKGCGRGNP